MTVRLATRPKTTPLHQEIADAAIGVGPLPQELADAVLADILAEHYSGGHDFEAYRLCPKCLLRKLIRRSAR